MNGIACPDLVSCTAIQSEVDAALCYPRPGKDIGGGDHAPPEQSITLTYAAPVPIGGGQFAYPVDAVNETTLSSAQALQVSAVAQAIQMEPLTP